MDSEYKELMLSDLSTDNPFDQMDLSGNTPVSSPEVNFNFASDYETSLSNGYMMRLRVDGAYIGDQWFSAYNDLIGFGDIRQDAYWVLNALAYFAEPIEPCGNCDVCLDPGEMVDGTADAVDTPIGMLPDTRQSMPFRRASRHSCWRRSSGARA